MHDEKLWSSQWEEYQRKPAKNNQISVIKVLKQVIHLNLIY